MKNLKIGKIIFLNYMFWEENINFINFQKKKK